LNGENNVSEEITNRLIAANRSYFGLKSQLNSQLLSRKTKIVIYKTLVRRIRAYAAETWTMKKNEHGVSSKRKSFAEYMVQYARDGSGGRDTKENMNSFTTNQI